MGERGDEVFVWQGVSKKTETGSAGVGLDIRLVLHFYTSPSLA